MWIDVSVRYYDLHLEMQKGTENETMNWYQRLVGDVDIIRGGSEVKKRRVRTRPTDQNGTRKSEPDKSAVLGQDWGTQSVAVQAD